MKVLGPIITVNALFPAQIFNNNDAKTGVDRFQTFA